MIITARSIGGLALLAALVATFMLATNAPQQTTAPSRASTTSIRTQQHVAAGRTENVSSPTRIAVDPRVAAKYRYLLEGMQTERSTRLLALLQARESAATAAEHDANERLDELERDVLAALNPMQRDTYLALRDSDPEQRALDDFVAGIAHDMPIDAHQRRDLLLSKLRHKRQFEQWREQSSLDTGPLSSQQRAYAHELLERALNDYRDAYLLEMRGQLDDEQFQRLSDYERTEFALELERLQQVVNAR